MRRLVVVVALLLVPAALAGRAAKDPPPDVSGLMTRVADFVASYYARAQSIICDENVRLESLGADLMSDVTPARRLLYELRVAWEAAPDGSAPDAQVLRTLISVNNRKPRDKDRDACMDPKAVSSEPLSMFLPDSQPDYIFTGAGRGKVSGRPATMIDYRSRQLGRITTTRKDDCFSIELPGRTRGRVWVDEETAEVLRLDERLTGIFDVDLPPDPKRREPPSTMVVERLDSSIVYRRVTFSDPEESVMLPATKETVSVIRNAGTPRLRTTQSFRNYRRFMTAGRIVE